VSKWKFDARAPDASVKQNDERIDAFGSFVVRAIREEDTVMPNTNSVNLNSRVARSEEILTSDLDDELAMMSIEHGTYSGLDAIGTEIWHLLEKPLTVSEICDEMMARYDVERDVCEKDVLAFLDDLASDHTIRVVEGAD